jgi:hypothetical protein
MIQTIWLVTTDGNAPVDGITWKSGGGKGMGESVWSDPQKKEYTSDGDLLFGG